MRTLIAILFTLAAGTAQADRLRVYDIGQVFTYNTTAATTVVTYGPPSSYVGTYQSSAHHLSDTIYVDSFERGFADPWSFQINTASGGVFASATGCTFLRASTTLHQVDLIC